MGRDDPGRHHGVLAMGRPNAARDNIVLVLHALTADTYVTGPGRRRPRSCRLVGRPSSARGRGRHRRVVRHRRQRPRRVQRVDWPRRSPRRQTVGIPIPHLTVLDQVRAEAALLDELGVTSVAAAVGGSMGGARALEWAVTYPERTRAALVLAVGARATADQIGTQTTQIAAIKADPAWQGGDYHGNRFRTDHGHGRGTPHRAPDLSPRGRTRRAVRKLGPGRRGYAAARRPLRSESYLDHQAEKIISRFDPASYVALTEVLNNHDVGRGRGGVRAALSSARRRSSSAASTATGSTPSACKEELARELGNCVGGLRVVESVYGHDAFLVEFDAIADLLRQTVALAR